jgi:hypothetical protein
VGYKAVLLWQDSEVNPRDWPVGVNGNYIHKIIDLPASNQVPDKRAWKLMTSEQATQYSLELEDDFINTDESLGRLTLDEVIDRSLERAEIFGRRLYKKFKRGNVKSQLTSAQIRALQKSSALKDVELLMKGGSLKALLLEMSEWSNPIVSDETVLEYGNEVRAYLGLDLVDVVADLHSGVE